MTDSVGAASHTPPKPPGLRERMRATVRAEVTQVALRLFTDQGFEQTTADQIAAEAGLSRASLFRYFGTKEDIVLGGLEGDGQQVVEALAARPDEERPWVALRRAFDVLVRVNEEEPEQTMSFLRLLQQTPSLRARHFEKQLTWQEQMVPEIARRLEASPGRPEDPRPTALVAAALACLDAAARAWVACDGTVSIAVLLDRAMDALTE
ncbi:TetR/AcrR family transcriptional regulator [Streptomyces sp. SP18BB07]|uniref:TetR/AcrR family transcriptional regulator n=1 Tax=Streptomyces sp. SP18BB07 TaxID=3002522 RepID=UPI002E75EB31|nr:TetR family transcriptional regulator [Streptomyces sp. SP18BB07]MEE1761195.1 TetR family transcriptional regulator [Streptomyces sp. SP18BB07]